MRFDECTFTERHFETIIRWFELSVVAGMARINLNERMWAIFSKAMKEKREGARLNKLAIACMDFSNESLNMAQDAFVEMTEVFLEGIETKRGFWETFEMTIKIRAEAGCGRLKKLRVHQIRFVNKSWCAAVQVFVMIRSVSLKAITVNTGMWNELTKAIEQSKAEGYLKLRRLTVSHCTYMIGDLMRRVGRIYYHVCLHLP